MQNKIFHITLSVALITVSSLVLSGCTYSSSMTPISKVQKDFKNELDLRTLHDAITNAAQEKDWDIVNQTSTSLSLKKTYQKVRVLTTPHERWRKVIVNNDVYVNVDINQKSLKMNLSDQSVQSLKTASEREVFNEDLTNLKKAIYMRLAETTL